MENKQEQISYSDYQIYKRVAKILAEDSEPEPENHKKDKPKSDDPYEVYREREIKLNEQRVQKLASITEEQIKEADGILDRIQW